GAAGRPPLRVGVVSAPAPDPVALIRTLGLEGAAPLVLLDSAGGGASLARRHYLAWDPVYRLTVKDGRVAFTPGPAAARAGDDVARRLAAAGPEIERLAPFAAVRAAARLAVELTFAADLEHVMSDTVGGAGPPSGEAGGGASPDGLPELTALVGLVSYDAARYLERLPDSNRDDLGLPDIDLFLPGVLLRHELDAGTAVVVERWPAEPAWADRVVAALAAGAASPAPVHGDDLPVFDSNFSRRDYQAVVARTREYVFAGDIFQANVSQRLDVCYTLPSLHLYATLRAVNPSPFAGYLHMGDYELISSSPERLVALRPDCWAETRPIAGTRPRGGTTGEHSQQAAAGGVIGVAPGREDDELAGELNLDPKERAEHVMLVDLERNDLGKVCEYGTVRVSELMVNEYYSHVIHIVSNVRGRLRPEKDGVDLLAAMFPGGTITGCPKVRCMEIIDELETVRRGPYTGSFGWLALDALDMNIIIRTLVRVGDRLYLQVGGGIVADSVPGNEYFETLHKATGMLRAVAASIAERPGPGPA
ncbi:MAG: anthranilate synthase component I family protein, partial [Thermoleophilia bacterium]|nr:anthranilate synthase component I family protein [Thermoleophilia bacterium]